jgi:hypothetical protein
MAGIDRSLNSRRHLSSAAVKRCASAARPVTELLEARCFLSGVTQTVTGLPAPTGIVMSVRAAATTAAVTTPAPVAIGPGTGTTPYPVLTTTTPTFQWDAVTGVTGQTGYQINLYDQTAAKFTSYQVGLTTSYVLPSGILTAGDTYVWNVRPVIGTTTGTESNYLYFQAPPAVVLPAPTAVGQGTVSTPGPELNTAEPTFQWDAVTGVTGLTGYQINVENTTANTFASYQVGTSVTSYTPPTGELIAGDSYVWNVRILVGSQSGPPSAYLNFQVPAAVTLPAPVAVGQGTVASPGPELNPADPTFQWDAVTGVTGLTGYQINVENVTTKTSASYQVGASVTSYSPTLIAGDSYLWNVRILVGTQSGPPSAYLNFQVPAAVVLPAPVAVGPGSSTKPGPVLTTLTPTLTWDAVTGVTGLTGYQIYLTDETLSKTFSYQVGASATSYTVPSGTLAAGDTFVWNVRVLVGTQSGPPSTYLYFQTPAAATLPAPVAIGPGSTVSPGPVLTTTTPTFQWDAVTGVTGLTGYQINLFDQTASKSYSYQVGATATSYTLPAGVLTTGDTYVWNVRILVGTQSGPPSAYLYFQAPAAVTLPAPVAVGPGSTTKPGPVLTTSTPTLTWNAVTGVSGLTGYQIYLTDETASKTFSYQVGASVTSYTVPSGTLAAGDTFVWNVRVLVGTQSGPPSTYLYFQTPAAVTLPAPVVVGPGSTASPGPLLTTDTPTFQWKAVTGVSALSGYQINVYDETSKTSFSFKTGASVTSYTVGAGVLTAGDAFVWNVRILAGTQSGPPSTYLYFQTPAAVAAANPETQIVAFTDKLTRLEDEQHETVRGIKAAAPGTASYTTLLHTYDETEKRIKELKSERAVLESET